MYRAVTYFAMINNCFEDGLFNSNKLKNTLDQIHISFKYNNDIGYSEVYLNDKNIESEIRSLEVSNFVSYVAAVSEVRKLMVKQQQAMGRNKGVVMDGRDIGTVVFKDAELKLFMTASSEVRANRRFEELISKGDNVKYEKVLENITKRKIAVGNLGDHRIAMCAFILGILTKSKTNIKNFETVFTSSPSFLNIMKSLGAKFEIKKK